MAGSARVRIGVVGYGEWGPNHVRTFANLPETDVVAIVDARPDRLGAARLRFRGCHAFASHTEMLEKESLDAVVVATPAATHAAIVRDSLSRGLHVLCEKPLCLRAREAETLVRLAAQKKVELMVGYVFLFNRGIVALRNLVQQRELGVLQYLTCTRTNLGPVRNDVNVAWDLASHDISIANFVVGRMPVEVSAVGNAYLREGIPDVSFATLRYPGDVLVNVHVSWLHPTKVRSIAAVGDRKMAMWDDLERLGPIRIFDKGVIREHEYADFGAFQLLTREGDVTVPRIAMEEPLVSQARHFLSVARRKEKCVSGGRLAVDVIRVLEAMDRSMAQHGRPQRINSPRKPEKAR